MITPHPLKKGDKIAIVATARKISKEEISFAKEYIESRGFTVVLGANLFAVDNQFAGTDIERTADLQRALNNDDIKAVLCARGGYGTVRIIDKLDFTNFVEHPKWICGYSDVTALHTHIQLNYDVQTLHSTMPINFKNNTKEALDSLFDALEGNNVKYEFPSHPLNRNGHCNGEVIGGNLSMIYSILGSNSIGDLSDRILFLEDLDEYLYHIDRMMMNLKRNGILDNIAGLIVGGMTDMNDNTVPFGKTAEEIIADAVKEYDYPVCFNFPAGHINDNRTIILGREISLNVEDDKVNFG